MGTYRNPDPTIVNTGSKVYEGIQKLTGDVFQFATEERQRKADLISESLAAQQAIDDDINMLGLNVEEGATNFEVQVYEEAQRAKQEIARQYDIMSKTFSTPAQRAKAKAEINRLNKFPDGLVADLGTGKYIVDEYNKALLKQRGQTGAISLTNDENLLAVTGDMRSGGKNTRIQTNEAGARTLVTTKNGKEYKLNITNITNGIKNNPDYALFRTVEDDKEIVDRYKTALGIDGKADIDTLIGNGILTKERRFDVAGKPEMLYTLNKDRVDRAASKLSTSLIEVPENYSFANSIWQDRIGEAQTLKGALGEIDSKTGKYKNEAEVLSKIRGYYTEKAIADAGKQFGVAVGVTLPKTEEVAGGKSAGKTKGPSNYEMARVAADMQPGGLYSKIENQIERWGDLVMKIDDIELPTDPATREALTKKQKTKVDNIITEVKNAIKPLVGKRKIDFQYTTEGDEKGWVFINQDTGKKRFISKDFNPNDVKRSLLSLQGFSEQYIDQLLREGLYTDPLNPNT